MERIPNEYIASTPLLTLRGPGESSAPAPAPAVSPAPVAAPAAPAPAVEQQPAAPATPPAEPAAPAEPADPIAALDHAGLMEHFRSQHPEAHASLIKRLADREIDRRANLAELAQLRESNSKLARMAQEKQQAAANPPSDGLTPFERSLREPAQPAAAAQPVAPAPGPVLVPPAQPPAQPEQPPMPAYLQTPAMAEAELAEAMASGDYQHAAEVRQQIFFMQQSAMRGQTEAMIRAEAERLFQERMGGIAPAMQNMVAQQQASESQAFAIGQLKEAGIPDIDTMFQPTSDQPLAVNGDQYPDTPMNRMVAQFPWITQIHVQHADPVTARNLTLIARYRAGNQMWQATKGSTQPAPQPAAAPAAPPAAPGLPPEAVAGVLSQIGQDLTASQAADRARAGINAGASAAASPSMPASERFLDSIGGGGVTDPLRGLFAARR